MSSSNAPPASARDTSAPLPIAVSAVIAGW
jgi:hypothetical protein